MDKGLYLQGLEDYTNKTILVVENGQAEKIGGEASVPIKVKAIQDKTLLMRKGESVRVIYEGKTYM